MNSRRRALLGIGNGSILPPQYQQVEYLESTGTQYIDTGVTISKSKSIECEVMPISVSGFTSLYGIYEAAHFVTAWITNNRLENQRFGTQTVAAPIQYGIKHIILHSDKGFVIDGTNYAYSSQDDFESTNTLYIFKTNNFGLLAIARLYKFIIYNNGVQFLSLIPCYRKSDNVAGMYDLVNDVFYTNQGTGTFTKGPDVN